ncbi:MAG: ABC transporter permease [Chloroflexota bacterium]|jgi:putative ABC transport system permease protein|nr:MAG: FtsX-like permease family protein [SAR202 cluster bacterium]MEC9013136.1 ABC transporter permease [Chloroflexota bacterium]GIS95092.1 MAG: multidrug ABC transporter substrate-binding protein [Dehalococcoidia bacterium]|tara:strand:+ start:5120 stop:6382 length:1263 start_codon:yes stop_codon:yes gene_type:complete
MTVLDAVRTSVKELLSNPLRSFLTLLGLIIGVSSVIIMVAVGQGAQEGVKAQIIGLGSDLTFVRPAASDNQQTGARGQAGSGLTLLASDAYAIKEASLSGVIGVVPQLNIDAQAIAGSNNLGVGIIGTTSDYASVRSLEVDYGRFIDDQDVERKALSIALGAEAGKSLFPDNDGIGKTVRLSFAGGRVGFNFRVVGVMAPQGGTGEGSQDDYVFIPVPTLQSRIAFLRNPQGEININQITIRSDPNVDQGIVKDEVTKFLLRHHSVVEPDFTVQTQNELISAQEEVNATLSILLGSIAGISLLVGAIGVMNIMIVSVVERTREIGIRRAVGATSKDIGIQFIIEALTVSVVGGALGILLGVGVAIGAGGYQLMDQELNAVIELWSIGLAAGVAVSVGFLSGVYPAFKAANVDPIVALRSA